MSLKNKLCFVFLYIVIIAVFSFVLVKEHRYANIEKEDLTTVTEIFTSSKKTKNVYRITCESGNEYLLTHILADDEHLNALNDGDVLELGLYRNDIIELISNGKTIISVEECNERYSKQFNVSIIVVPSLTIGLIIITFGINFLLKRLEAKSKIDYNVNDVKEYEIIDKKVYANIQNSIYKKNGILRCNILEQIESDKLVYTFYKSMLDYINEKELVLLIDDCCSNDELALVFYKNKEKLYFTEIYRERKEPFEIEKTLFWYYPYNSKLTKSEQIEFVQAVEDYIRYNPDLLK